MSYYIHGEDPHSFKLTNKTMKIEQQLQILTDLVKTQGLEIKELKAMIANLTEVTTTGFTKMGVKVCDKNPGQRDEFYAFAVCNSEAISKVSGVEGSLELIKMIFDLDTTAVKDVDPEGGLKRIKSSMAAMSFQIDKFMHSAFDILGQDAKYLKDAFLPWYNVNTHVATPSWFALV